MPYRPYENIKKIVNSPEVRLKWECFRRAVYGNYKTRHGAYMFMSDVLGYFSEIANGKHLPATRDRLIKRANSHNFTALFFNVEREIEYLVKHLQEGTKPTPPEDLPN